jgi:hypothetical protein
MSLPGQMRMRRGVALRFTRAMRGITSSTWKGSRMSSGSSAARPIGTVIDTCQEWAPASKSRSVRGSICVRAGRAICVLAETGMPTARRLAMASMAARHEPFTPRSWSCRDSSASTETERLCTPASRTWAARSGVIPRPPVTMVSSMPFARTAFAMVTQSSRRYASPPMRVTSLHSRSAS